MCRKVKESFKVSGGSMKKIGFIIPHFGKFNNYFQLFLNSCEFNVDCDWIIFTDDYTAYSYPKNVKVHYMSFEEVKKVFQSKFDFPISLEYPYKLCDYKVSYGYVFSEYLSEYKFWGHCDTDLIFGKISNFISDIDLETYDKIGILGHCTIYKNDDFINKVFMKKLDGKERYKEVFTSNENFSFDEEYNSSINNIFEEQNLMIKNEQYEANIYTKSSNFRITRMNLQTKKYTVEKKKDGIFVFDNGRLIRIIYENNELVEEEYLYIHMQSRPMSIRLLDLNAKKFKIIPNTFEEIELENIDINTFRGIKKKYFNLHYFKLRSKNLYRKIMKRINKRNC